MPIEKICLALANKRGKLLIVDDEALNIRIIHELLHKEFDIFMASTGQQAIAKARDLQPDLILLDIVMPEMDGYDVCRILKADVITRAIPIIFVTAHFDEAEEVFGFELGAADFIHKPINPVITKARIHNQITLKQQKDLLRSLALTDTLTGIANRRKFNEELELAWMQASREQKSISLLMIDIDFFKQYNDRYGHLIGDDCLQLVAHAFKQSMNRPYDLAARYGGEEFACILPQTNLQGAIHIAERILASIRQLKIAHQDAKPDGILTVSIGAASIYPNDTIRPSTLIDAADQQLYAAKHNGRARVCATALV